MGVVAAPFKWLRRHRSARNRRLCTRAARSHALPRRKQSPKFSAALSLPLPKRRNASAASAACGPSKATIRIFRSLITDGIFASRFTPDFRRATNLHSNKVGADIISPDALVIVSKKRRAPAPRKQRRTAQSYPRPSAREPVLVISNEFVGAARVDDRQPVDFRQDFEDLFLARLPLSGGLRLNSASSAWITAAATVLPVRSANSRASSPALPSSMCSASPMLVMYHICSTDVNLRPGFQPSRSRSCRCTIPPRSSSRGARFLPR